MKVVDMILESELSVQDILDRPKLEMLDIVSELCDNVDSGRSVNRILTESLLKDREHGNST